MDAPEARDVSGCSLRRPSLRAECACTRGCSGNHAVASRSPAPSSLPDDAPLPAHHVVHQVPSHIRLLYPFRRAHMLVMRIRRFELINGSTYRIDSCTRCALSRNEHGYVLCAQQYVERLRPPPNDATRLSMLCPTD
jgi:hypothetical protein